MKCAWNAFLGILPPKYRVNVDKLGRESLQELRLRLNEKPELVTSLGSRWLEDVPTAQDLAFVVNMASRYMLPMQRGYQSRAGVSPHAMETFFICILSSLSKVVLSFSFLWTEKSSQLQP